MRRRIRRADHRVDFLPQALFGKNLRAAKLDAGHPGQRSFHNLKSYHHGVLVYGNTLQNLYVYTSISKVNHVRFDGAAIFFQKSVVGKSAAKASKKRQKPQPAGLSRFQFRLNVNHREFVGSGNTNVGQLQTPAEGHVIGYVNCMAGEFRRIKIKTSFTSAVFAGIRRGRRDHARRVDRGKEVTLLLNLVADAAPAFLDHREVDVAFALDRQQFARLLFL